MEYKNLEIVILAAGNSSRMRTSKQLLDIGGVTLLEKTVACAANSKIPNVTVVLGSNSQMHIKNIKGKQVQILTNPDWALGIGNTLKFSMKKLLQNNINTQGVLFMVCDQPRISTVHINNLIELFLKEKPVAVASRYKETYGVPALFDRIAFSSLLSINDSSGAKAVLQKLKTNLKFVPFDGGEIDLDTPEEYERFMSQNKKS